jgi:hypothetical protein
MACRSGGCSTPDDCKETGKLMKKLALLVSFALVAGIASAHDEAKKAETKPAAPVAEKAAAAAPAAEKAAAGKTHEVSAEVVSADVTASTITLKGEKENKTVPVDAKAAPGLKTVKAGDKVTLTCWDDEKGAHQKVVAIAPAKAVTAPEKK